MNFSPSGEYSGEEGRGRGFLGFLMRAFRDRNKEGFAGGYDMGELDQALFLYLEGQERSSSREQRREWARIIRIASLPAVLLRLFL